jgi:hypothetical protein
MSDSIFLPKRSTSLKSIESTSDDDNDDWLKVPTTGGRKRRTSKKGSKKSKKTSKKLSRTKKSSKKSSKKTSKRRSKHHGGDSEKTKRAPNPYMQAIIDIRTALKKDGITGGIPLSIAINNLYKANGQDVAKALASFKANKEKFLKDIETITKAQEAKRAAKKKSASRSKKSSKKGSKKGSKKSKK